uniref:Virion structural protein n=1 Tax=Pseudomonas phage RVTF4 TaxID=3236931 RepID=A0AB39CDA8_9VIRU
MAEIISNVEPGRYATGQTIRVTFPPNTRKAIITTDDRAPVLTEILAYDNGPILPIPSPPDKAAADANTNPKVDRPFIAVTQDGRGNVTFDGGFPKFYNSHVYAMHGNTIPPLDQFTSWSQVPPAFKYLDNCLKFCANPRKVLAGNRKILVMNTAKPTEHYNAVMSVRGVPPVGQGQPGYANYALRSASFKDSLEIIGKLGNWEVTLTQPPTTTDKYDYDLAYLDQFAAVIFMGTTAYAPVVTESQRRLTVKCAEELSLYRMNGNGLILITDHTNKNFTDIEDAQNGYIFSPDVNRIAKYFSTYFSGDVWRDPVPVSEIRRQLSLNGGPGDHPLLDGLTNDDYIFAGGSESLVIPQLYTTDEVDPNTVWTKTYSTKGTYRVNVLAQLDDGTILTRPMRFTIIDPADFTLQDSFSRTVGGNFTTPFGIVDLSVTTITPSERTMDGEIWVEGKLCGYFRTALLNGSWNTSYQPFGGSGAPIVASSTSKVEFKIKAPFEYTMSTVINNPSPVQYNQASMSMTTWPAQIAKHPFFNGKTYAESMAVITTHVDKYYTTARNMGQSKLLGVWGELGKGRLPFTNPIYDPLNAAIYQTEALFLANQPAIANRGDCIVIVENAAVYYWEDLTMKWVKHPKTAKDLWLLNWYIKDSITGKIFHIRDTNLVQG